MNKWVGKSIALASGRGYLDNLMRVYPVNLTLGREISTQVKINIKKALVEKNTEKLISTLLDLERFPIDDPYIGFLRKDKQALIKNPKTAKRLGKRLLDMGFEGILAGVSRAKTPSRQVGQMFKNWLCGLGYPVLNEKDFLKSRRVAMLKGGDNALKKFAKEKLGYRGQKGLDMVLKVKNKFVIGEAKFITTSGGTQDKSFREAMLFIKKKQKDVIKVAALDGVAWLVSNNRSRTTNLYGDVLKLKENEIALSALLLKEFIKSL